MQNRNLALNKPIQASSSENDDLSAIKVVDGSLNTRWASQWSDPQTFIVDLEDYFDISRITIFWEAAYSSKYTVELSQDAVNWEPCVNEGSGNGGKDDWEINSSGHQRYAKFTGIKRATQYGYSMYEFEVYGKQSEIAVNVKDVNDSAQDTVQLCPNPVSDLLRIKGISNDEFVEIYNEAGRLVKSL